MSAHTPPTISFPVEESAPQEPSPAPPKRSGFPWLNLALFAATLASTLFVGFQLGRFGLFGFALPPLVSGALFAGALLLILGAHELGHYFAAHAHDVEVTLPYFIPMPIGLGTLGAFIRMRSPIPNRRVLFDVGVAGPLAGLVVALPLFIAGLMLAPAQPHPLLYGDGLLPRALIFLVERLRGLEVGEHVMIHPLSFAAYIGLFITALNLLPAGQLDGGHMAYALLGRRSSFLTFAVIAALVAIGLFASRTTWLIWAGFIAFTGLHHPPTLDPNTSLNAPRILVMLFSIFLLILLFALDPLPVFR